MLDLGWLRDLPWLREARCAEPRYNPEAWFPSQSQRKSGAKAVCRQCGVQGACLAYAIREDIRDGIWGGATPTERKKLAKLSRVDACLVDPVPTAGD